MLKNINEMQKTKLLIQEIKSLLFLSSTTYLQYKFHLIRNQQNHLD